VGKRFFAVKHKWCRWSDVESKLNTYRSWLGFLQSVETYFNNSAFLKVSTPTLVCSGAMESSLHPFKIKGRDLELPTSPEFSLKKLWLSGFSPRLFEISSSFRGEELGPMHLDEFTMIEFYLAEASFEDLIKLTNDFLSTVLMISPQSLRILSIHDLFKTFVGFELQPDSNEAYLTYILNFHGIRYPKTATWSDLFHLLFIEKIEPVLSSNLIALKNYPPQLSALAKINSSGWSDRVEFYFKGIELGNGYNELLDAKEVLKRWKFENKIRKTEGLEGHILDRELINLHENRKISSGVGMAIGLERLFWLTHKSADEHIKVWPFES